MSTDRDGWLLPIYCRLKTEHAFEQLAPVIQYKRLMEAAAAVSESGAALLVQSSPAAQVALLGHLAMMEAQRPLDPSEELWRVRAEKQQEAMAQEQAKRAVLTALCPSQDSGEHSEHASHYDYSVYMQNVGTRSAREVYWRIAIQKAPPGFDLQITPAADNVELKRYELSDDNNVQFLVLEGRYDAAIYESSDVLCAEVRIIHPKTDKVPETLTRLEYVLKCQDGRFPPQGWGTVNARLGLDVADNEY